MPTFSSALTEKAKIMWENLLRLIDLLQSLKSFSKYLFGLHY